MNRPAHIIRIYLPRKMGWKIWFLSVLALLFTTIILLHSSATNSRQSKIAIAESSQLPSATANPASASSAINAATNAETTATNAETTAANAAALETPEPPVPMPNAIGAQIDSIFENGTERQHTKRSQFFSQLNDRHRLMSQLLHKKRILLESILRRPTATATPSSHSRSWSDQHQETNASLSLSRREAELRASVATVAHFSFLYTKNLAYLPHIKPVKTSQPLKINSFFGLRLDPFGGRFLKHHDGVDLKSSLGQTVYAAADGVVIETRRSRRGYGNMIRIAHRVGYETLYAHLKKISVRKGANVIGGQVIGQVGATGNVTGPHLHYEVRYKKKVVDPLQFGIRN